MSDAFAAQGASAAHCPLYDPSCLAGVVLKPIVGEAASAASAVFDHVCQEFADAASSLLTTFADGFTSTTTLDLGSTGTGPLYALCGGIAMLIAGFLVILQITRTVWQGRGEALAQALVGMVRLVLAFLLTLTVTGSLLALADSLTAWIVSSTLGSQEQFSDRLGKVFAFSGVNSPVLLLIFAVVGIFVTVLLWLELLFRNAAVVVLVATSPIAAAGQVGTATSAWWSKLVTATLQLIMLKPVIALVFAIGFSVSGSATGVEGLLAGLLILVLAVFAWPVIAGMFTFTTTQAAAAGGIGALLGFAGGRASAASAGGSGVAPGQLGAYMESRSAPLVAQAMTGQRGRAGVGAGAMAGSASTGSAASGAVGAAGPVGAVIGVAQKSLNATASKMHQMGQHAGLSSGPPPRPGGSPAMTTTSSRTTGGLSQARSAPAATQPPPPTAPIRPSDGSAA